MSSTSLPEKSDRNARAPWKTASQQLGGMIFSFSCDSLQDACKCYRKFFECDKNESSVQLSLSIRQHYALSIDYFYIY